MILMEEILLDVELKGHLRVRNVPHIKREGFGYTMKSSVEAKMAVIYEYMKAHKISELDFNQCESLP
ncbi:hypothetical protein D1872_50840 [compost metagenome]